MIMTLIPAFDIFKRPLFQKVYYKTCTEGENSKVGYIHSAVSRHKMCYIGLFVVLFKGISEYKNRTQMTILYIFFIKF